MKKVHSLQDLAQLQKTIAATAAEQAKEKAAAEAAQRQKNADKDLFTRAAGAVRPLAGVGKAASKSARK
jgi:hypothetical protein